MANADYTKRAGGYGFCPVGFLTADIGPLDTAVTMTGYTSPVDDGIRAGMAAMIGDEIVRVTSFVGVDLVLGRGCCDTVPAEHSTGDPIWFFDDSIASDEIEYAGIETIGVKVLPKTSTQEVPIEYSPPQGLTFNLRFARPYPPGLVELNGDPWFQVKTLDAILGSLDLTWAHRDRVAQTDQLIDHMEASIGPEAGSTYRIRVFDADDIQVREETGITGTSWSYDHADAITDFSLTSGTVSGYITLETMRDGLESFQLYRIDFTLDADLYGLGYRLGQYLGGYPA